MVKRGLIALLGVFMAVFSFPAFSLGEGAITIEGFSNLAAEAENVHPQDIDMTTYRYDNCSGLYC